MEPEIGMGATVHFGSDSYPYTVIEIERNWKTGEVIILTLREDKVTRTDDRDPFTESQDYAYADDPDGRIMIARKRRDGTWRAGKGAQIVTIGKRRMYRDPSF